ncbi:hypothetical protein DL771_008936 [Monosporascus sp. 5C6A]|nr:hypothetical protein DL771_008936 [Monosporascus sp. 5C6A]
MAHNLLYKPLDRSRNEIRLIIILPCENDDEPVACRLETASLNDEVEYVAMSYVWGDPSVTKNIVVNDTVFPVTTNLEAGLWHFRKYGLLPCEDKTGDARLWVDAICINQQDVPERNQQVALMGVLFRNANFVLSWLGLPGKYRIDNSLRLMKSFTAALPHELRLKVLGLNDRGNGGNTEMREDDSNEEVNGPHNPESELIQEGLRWIAGQPAWHYDKSTGNRNDVGWGSFTGLAHLPYWRRVWIHQERALSKSSSRNLLRCGAELATWEDFVVFFSLIRAFDNNSVRPPEIYLTLWVTVIMALKMPIVTFTSVLKGWWKSGRAVPYLVLRIAEVSEATDPRDMVYGLRSLLNLDLEVNYEKSVRQVYLDWHAEVTAQSLENGEIKVDLISRAGIGLYEENEHNFPSWLPNLSRLHEKSFVRNVNERTDMAAKINLGSPREQHYSEDGVLSVHGAICDQVAGIAPPLDDVANDLKNVSELIGDYVSYMKEKDHPTGIRPLQASYYTLHRGIDPYTGQPFTRELNLQSAAALIFRAMYHHRAEHIMTTGDDWDDIDLEACEGLVTYLDFQPRDCENAADTKRWRSAPGATSQDERDAEMKRLADSMYRLKSEAVFYTTDGYIGIGPRYAQVGDRLCVIDNCSLPVLLRMEGSACRLVGAAYAYGLSETQPRETIQSGGFKLEMFKIH